jgi:hypothetical protein
MDAGQRERRRRGGRNEVRLVFALKRMDHLRSYVF